MPSLGASRIACMGFFGETRATAISLSYTPWTRTGLELIAGGRFGLGPDVPGTVLDGFVAATLAPTFVTLDDEQGRTGAWRPSLALEAGASMVRRA
jgi:hypothetical protein